MKHSTFFKIIALNFLLLTITAKASNVVFFIDIASADAWSPSTATIELGDTVLIKIKDGEYNFSLVTTPSGAAPYSTPIGNPQNVGTFYYVPTVLGVYNFSSGWHNALGSFTVNAATPSITTGIVSTLAVCSGNPLTIPFTYKSTITGFSAELSNASGSFTSPTALAATSVTGNAVVVSIPAGLPTGTGYRVRVVATTPAVTGSANSQDISVNVSTTATPDIKINITPQGAICPGTVVTHTGSAIGLTNARYDWYVNNALASGNINPFVFSTFQNGNTSYVIVSGMSGGCTTTPYSTTLVGNVMTVASSVTPTLSIDLAPINAICFHDDVTITGIPSGGGSSPTYQLSVTGTYTSTTTSGSAFIIKEPRNGVKAALVMTSNLSCASPLTAASNVLTVNLIPSTPTIALTTCTGTSCLSSLSITSLVGASYQWYKNNIAIGGSTSNSFIPTITGSYKISVSNSSCSYTSTGFNITVTSVSTEIQNETGKGKISIYPNPAAGKLTISTELAVSGLSVKIYDLSQKLVLSKTFISGANLNDIDVSSLSVGLYIVHVTDGNSVLLSSKLVKQ
jgi:hypothetical protein